MAVFGFTQVFVVLLGYWLYQHGQWIRNSLVLPPLPHGYYAGGNANASCKHIRDHLANELKFCEDVTLWHAGTSPRLLVSCDPNRLEWNTVMGPMNNPNPKGSIWIYEFDKPGNPSPRRLLLDGFPETSDFHPLGVDVLPATRTEPAHLFIINHGRNYSTVEQFTLVGGKDYARYVRTWEHSAIHTPNAVVPLSPTSFYLTNDHRFTRRLPAPIGDIVPLAETLLSFPGGWVDRLDFVEGKVKVTRAISHIPLPNGIALSPDGAEVALASSTEGTVQLYDRDSATNALTFRERIYVPHCPDNVSYDDKKGTIIVAGHPHYPSLANLIAKKSQTSPSWVTEIEKRNVPDEVPADAMAPYSAYQRVSPSPNYKLTTIYQSDGRHYSSSSTGISYGNNFFVAGLYADGLLHCKST